MPEVKQRVRFFVDEWTEEEMSSPPSIITIHPRSDQCWDAIDSLNNGDTIPVMRGANEIAKLKIVRRSSRSEFKVEQVPD